VAVADASNPFAVNATPVFTSPSSPPATPTSAFDAFNPFADTATPVFTTSNNTSPVTQPAPRTGQGKATPPANTNFNRPPPAVAQIHGVRRPVVQQEESIYDTIDIDLGGADEDDEAYEADHVGGGPQEDIYGSIDADAARAKDDWFKQGASQGDATAQYYLGLRLELVEGDTAAAKYWYGLAKEGLARPPHSDKPKVRYYRARLALLFGEGKQVHHQLAQAARVGLHPLAEGGDAQSQHQRAECLWSGWGGPQDKGRSIAARKQAAAQGYPLANIWLGEWFLQQARKKER